MQHEWGFCRCGFKIQKLTKRLDFYREEGFYVGLLKEIRDGRLCRRFRNLVCGSSNPKICKFQAGKPHCKMIPTANKMVLVAYYGHSSFLFKSAENGPALNMNAMFVRQIRVDYSISWFYIHTWQSFVHCGKILSSSNQYRKRCLIPI